MRLSIHQTSADSHRAFSVIERGTYRDFMRAARRSRAMSGTAQRMGTQKLLLPYSRFCSRYQPNCRYCTIFCIYHEGYMIPAKFSDPANSVESERSHPFFIGGGLSKERNQGVGAEKVHPSHFGRQPVTTSCYRRQVLPSYRMICPSNV